MPLHLFYWDVWLCRKNSKWFKIFLKWCENSFGNKRKKRKEKKGKTSPSFFFPLDPLPWPLRPATRSNGQLRQWAEAQVARVPPPLSPFCGLQLGPTYPSLWPLGPTCQRTLFFSFLCRTRAGHRTAVSIPKTAGFPCSFRELRSYKAFSSKPQLPYASKRRIKTLAALGFEL